MFPHPTPDPQATLPDALPTSADQASGTGQTPNTGNDNWGVEVQSQIFGLDGTGATQTSPTVQVSTPR
jgi:hypothetical protein